MARFEAAVASARERRPDRRGRRAPRPAGLVRRADGRVGPASGSRARARRAVPAVRDGLARRLVRRGDGRGQRARSTGSPRGSTQRTTREKERFLDTIEAGVVYVNRRAGATTGAWPGTQTFCGWKSSGSTGKGGLGPWYLPQFMREQSRTIVE